MTATQAARIIGCSPQQVRVLIRKGTIKATRWDMPGGYYYDVSQVEAERYRDTEQTKGWPRGQSYTWEE